MIEWFIDWCLTALQHINIFSANRWARKRTQAAKDLSDLSVKHHFYADDTQLFISFSALDFTLNIAQLKTTIDNVSAWMSAILSLS